MATEENKLLDEGKMLAIEAIIRSQFGTVTLEGGNQALDILRHKEQNPTKRRQTRYSTRQMPAIRRSNSMFGTIVAALLGAIIPLAIGFLVFLYIKQLEATLPGKPNLSFVSSEVIVKRDQQEIKAFNGFVLLPKDEIVTKNSARAEILYEDGSHVVLEQNSQIMLYKIDNQKKLLSMTKGLLFAEIAKQKTNSNFFFYTKNSLVNVVGTSFELNSENDKTKIMMKTGQVKVTNLVTKEEQLVNGGEQLTINTMVKPKAIVKKEIAQLDIPNLLNLYSFKNQKDHKLIDINAETSTPIDFEMHKANPPAFMKSSGIIISPQTYFSSHSMPQLLSQFANKNEFSIELWVKPNEDSLKGEDALIFGAGSSTSNIGNFNWLIYLGQVEGKLRVALHTVGQDEDFIMLTSQNFLEEKPNHIVLEKDSQGNLRLFLNGALTSEGSFTKSLNSWVKISGNLFFGGTQSASHSWQGNFYLMAFYDRALTQDEIEANYQEQY